MDDDLPMHKMKSPLKAGSELQIKVANGSGSFPFAPKSGLFVKNAC